MGRRERELAVRIGQGADCSGRKAAAVTRRRVDGGACARGVAAAAAFSYTCNGCSSSHSLTSQRPPNTLIPVTASGLANIAVGSSLSNG